MDRGDAAGRKRFHLHHRLVGGAVQDRRDVGRGGADRLADGSEAGEAGQQSRCGVVGQLRHFGANWPARIVATDKETGKVAWETNMSFDAAQLRITAAPLPIKDRIIIGASGGDSGVRDWVAGLDAASGKMLWRKFTIPAPGEPGSETWKGA